MFVPHPEEKKQNQWYETSGHKLKCLEAWQKQKCEQGGPVLTGEDYGKLDNSAATQLQSNLPCGIMGPVLTDLLPF